MAIRAKQHALFGFFQQSFICEVSTTLADGEFFFLWNYMVKVKTGWASIVSTSDAFSPKMFNQ